MAVTVRWSDGSSATWEAGVKYGNAPGAPRPAFDVRDDGGGILAVVPDFEVRYIGQTPEWWGGPGEQGGSLCLEYEEDDEG